MSGWEAFRLAGREKAIGSVPSTPGSATAPSITVWRLAWASEAVVKVERISPVNGDSFSVLTVDASELELTRLITFGGGCHR